MDQQTGQTIIRLLMVIAFILLVGREKAGEAFSQLPWIMLGIGAVLLVLWIAFSIIKGIWDAVAELLYPITRFFQQRPGLFPRTMKVGPFGSAS